MLKLRGIDAKRVIVALANMMGFASVKRLKLDDNYCLVLWKHNGTGTHWYLMEVLHPASIYQTKRVICKNNDWLSLLNNLENKLIYNYGRDNIQITCLEELIIKLQLDGWLKPFTYETS